MYLMQTRLNPIDVLFVLDTEGRMRCPQMFWEGIPGSWKRNVFSMLVVHSEGRRACVVLQSRGDNVLRGFDFTIHHFFILPFHT